MELRTFITFEADFPDDAKFTSGGDIERPGGFAIAEALCRMLRDCGLKVSNPEQHSFYGWAFIVSEKDTRIWFVLQYPDPWLLLSLNKTFFFKRLFSSRPASQHRRILEMLNDLLAHDSRFQKISSFTEEEYGESERKRWQLRHEKT